MTATTAGVIVTEPGFYDLTDEEYFSDPIPEGSLSSSGARKLLPPSCPALFKYERFHGQAPKAAFDLGHAAHKLVLGSGPELVEIRAEDWRTKAAKEARDEAYAAGMVPVLSRELGTVQDMAAAIRSHPKASVLLDPARGEAEQSGFWFDTEFSLWRRAKFDFVPFDGPGRLVGVDYKTAVSANPDSIKKSVANYGYHQQDAWYRDTLAALTGDTDPVLLFVVQEKTAPYIVTVVELDYMAVKDGRELNRRAMDLYVRCVADDHWPAYSDDITLIGLPPWARPSAA